MRSRTLALLCVACAGFGCETPPSPPGDSSSGAQSVQIARKTEAVPEGPACGTMRDVAHADVAIAEGDFLFYLDEAEGFSAVDLRDPERPRTAAHLPFVGTPLALYLRAERAWTVEVDWRVPGAATRIRAVDVTRPDAPRIVGEAAVPGIASGTALVGGVMYVLAGRPATLTAFRFDPGAARIERADAVPLSGAAAALAASPAGLAAVTTTDRDVVVSWIDPSYDRPGAMAVRGTRAFAGGFPAWEREIVSADEGQAVRLLACASPACLPEDVAHVRVVDFSGGGADVRASVPLPVGTGVPVVRFVDDFLYVAGGGQLRTVALHPVPRVVASTHLAGDVSTLRAYGTHLVAIGTVGSPAAGVRVAVHDVDRTNPASPRVRGKALFGDDWTWTRAADDDRAMSVDETSDLVAIPFATWRARDGRYATGAQLVALGEGRPSLGATLPADGHVERAMFVRGKLYAVGGGTVTVLRQREMPLELRVR